MLFDLVAFITKPIACDEFDEGILHNPTAIGTHINNFIAAYGMRNNPLALTLQGTHIQQTLASQAYPTNNTHYSKHSIINHIMLDAQDDDHAMVYTCAIDRSVVMQYQLLAVTHGLNLQSIATDTMAYINLYRHIHNHTKPSLNNAPSCTPQDFIVEQNALNRIIQLDGHIHRTVGYTDIIVALGAVIPLI